MITKQSHPFIHGTLESSVYWTLELKCLSPLSEPWVAYLIWNNDPSSDAMECEGGSTPTEALDRLEAVLQGRDSLDELARITEDLGLYDSGPDPEHIAYLERWKDAPEWARWLSQDSTGGCHWHESKPFCERIDNKKRYYVTGGKSECASGSNLLGSARLELRRKLSDSDLGSHYAFCERY